MTSGRSAGAIWHLKVNFGGGTGGKYAVLLNTPTSATDPLVFALTTSQGVDRYPSTQSPCGHPQNPFFRFDTGQVSCFSKATWVEFTNIHPMAQDESTRRTTAGLDTFLLSLTDGLTRSVMNCALYSDDIRVGLYKLIDATKKAMDAAAKAARAQAARPVQTNPAPPTKASAKMRARATAHRPRMLLEVCELLEIGEHDFDGKCDGKDSAAFLEHVEAAFDLLK